MALTLELTPDVEARLRDHAAREGRDEAAVAVSLLDASLAPGGADEARPAPGGGYPAGFFEQTYGSLAADPSAAGRVAGAGGTGLAVTTPETAPTPRYLPDTNTPA